jgi:hypothetical protein
MQNSSRDSEIKSSFCNGLVGYAIDYNHDRAIVNILWSFRSWFATGSRTKYGNMVSIESPFICGHTQLYKMSVERNWKSCIDTYIDSEKLQWLVE